MYTVDLVDSPDRLRALWEMDALEYQDSNLPFETFRCWWERYDLGLRVALNSIEQIQGGMGLWGLSTEQVRGLIAGQVRESDLTPMTCKQLTENPTQFWYVSGIFVKQQRSLGSPLRRLLHSGAGSWAKSTHVKYPLHCYALGYSADGVRLLQRFGFEQIKAEDETADRLPLYWREFAYLSDLRSLLP